MAVQIRKLQAVLQAINGRSRLPRAVPAVGDGSVPQGNDPPHGLAGDLRDQAS